MTEQCWHSLAEYVNEEEYGTGHKMYRRYRRCTLVEGHEKAKVEHKDKLGRRWS